MAIWTGMRGAGRASKPPSRARRSTRNGTVFAVYVDGPEKSGALFGEQTSMFRDLTSLGKELDVDVTVLTPGYARTRNGWRWDESGARWESVAMAYPDVVIRRSGSFRHASPRTVQADLRHFASAQRLHTLPREISNKWTFYQKMNDHASIRHALPHTHVANGPEHVLRALSRYEDVYLKPLNGAQGVGVVRVMVEDGEPVALYEQRIPPAGKGRPEIRVMKRRLAEDAGLAQFWSDMRLHRCLVQQTVALPRTKDERPIDFRWLVQCTDKFQVMARVARVGRTGAVTTNIHSGGEAIPAERALQQLCPGTVAEALRRMDTVALAVADRLYELYGPYAEVGVDLAIRPTLDVTLFEVNPTPGRRMLRALPGDVRELSLRGLLEYAIRATGVSAESDR